MAKVNHNFIRRTFQKIDAKRDGQLTKAEIKKHLGKVGIGGGFFGIVHTKAAGKFIDTFDQNSDKQVSWAEFQSKAKSLLPGALFDSKGKANQATRYFQSTDRNGDGQVSIRELKRAILQALPKGTSFKGTIADIGAKLGVDLLDANGDKKISREELKGALQALQKLHKG